ncbi:hypothetical protein V8F20_000191 [Naviculisporaceae sp. PSN 640]
MGPHTYRNLFVPSLLSHLFPISILGNQLITASLNELPCLVKGILFCVSNHNTTFLSPSLHYRHTKGVSSFKIPQVKKMAPLVPHWKQPSHPEIQEVIINEAEFTSKSISRVTLPPFALYAKLDFPPCTPADEPTYATVQMGRDQHLNLNSDLLYINHSCEPSVIFDIANRCVIAGPNGLQAGEELTFFYPSTEWDMAQPFDCLCGKPTCRGRISGAKDMTDAQLEGVWLNGHIRDLLAERKAQQTVGVTTNGNGTTKAEKVSENGTSLNGHHAEEEEQKPAVETDQTAKALEEAVRQAEKVVEAARHALFSYIRQTGGAAATKDVPAGAQRRGPTSRELSGEMGGDTNGAPIAV